MPERYSSEEAWEESQKMLKNINAGDVPDHTYQQAQELLSTTPEFNEKGIVNDIVEGIKTGKYPYSCTRLINDVYKVLSFSKLRVVNNVRMDEPPIIPGVDEKEAELLYIGAARQSVQRSVSNRREKIIPAKGLFGKEKREMVDDISYEKAVVPVKYEDINPGMGNSFFNMIIIRRASFRDSVKRRNNMTYELALPKNLILALIGTDREKGLLFSNPNLVQRILEGVDPEGQQDFKNGPEFSRNRKLAVFVEPGDLSGEPKELKESRRFDLSSLLEGKEILEYTI
ncbi:MAG: hypothetical protein JWO40_750 [Candidatus Doudnabacteria bacterium]|nr:hypothetical protein [Candidatus Doudnabacteria bacterium]